MLNRRSFFTAALGAAVAAPAVAVGAVGSVNQAKPATLSITVKSFRKTLADESFRTIWVTRPGDLFEFEDDSLDIINVVISDCKARKYPMYCAVSREDGTLLSMYHNIPGVDTRPGKVSDRFTWPAYPVRLAKIDLPERAAPSPEGSIVDLARARTASFADGKVIVFSTKPMPSLAHALHIDLR